MSAALPYWVERILTLQRPGSNLPGSLAKHVAVEYLFPLIPPLMATSLSTSVGAGRGFGTITGSAPYAYIFFRINFGFIVPDAFDLVLVAKGVVSYSGTLQGYQIESGIDYFEILRGGEQYTAYITNRTNMNQYFELVSQYLRVESEEDLNYIINFLKYENKGITV